MGPHLTFETHIKHLCKNACYHLRNIAKLQPTLCQSDAETLVHASVSSRMDYYNVLLTGIPGRNLQRLHFLTELLPCSCVLCCTKLFVVLIYVVVFNVFTGAL